MSFVLHVPLAFLAVSMVPCKVAVPVPLMPV
jgi:hypothetical protein